jgi:DNA-binding transcriptional LysR family regulator
MRYTLSSLLETSQLQTLVAVANAGSFSKAAENLNVTQSAISQSVKNLEKKLDVNLFKRLGKKVVLSSEGEKLYKLAIKFLSQLSETLDEIAHDKDAMSGKVRIGTLNGVGKSWLAHELLDFAVLEKDLTVSIKLAFRDDLVADFENHKLDFLILPESDLPASGERVFLSEEKATLVYPKTMEIDKNLTLEEFIELPTVLFEWEDPLYYNFCATKFGQRPHKVNAKFVVNSHGSMLHAVNLGLGVAVVPNHVLSRSFYKDKIRTLGPGYEVSNGNFYLLYHQSSLELMRMRKTLERLTQAENPLSQPHA